MKKNILIILSIITVAACNSNNSIYQKYENVNNHAWHIDSVKKFNFNIDDTTQKYNLLLGVRNGSEYNYSNIYLFVKTILPSKKEITDTVEIMLANAEGKWLGKKTASLIDNQILYKKNILFPTKGNYTLTIQQGMRAEILADIYDLGLVINKTGN